jgi:uncharacterized protein YndB with AHSA1/START domain
MFNQILTIAFLMISVSLFAENNSEKMEINWPEEYLPEESSFYIHNEIMINASPETIWKVIIDAEAWPEYYDGAENVKIITNEEVLSDSSVFTWKTMGLNFRSTIREFVPYKRLSWESNKWNIRGYHAWLLIPTENGTLLITDESQNGWLTFFEKIFQPNKLKKLHDKWLELIKSKAEVEYEISERIRGTK